MVVTATALIQGPATIWAAVFGATEPMPFVTGAPAVAWVDLGGTSDGVTLLTESEWSEQNVDQLVETVGSKRTKRKTSIKTNLAEATLENYARAIANSAPASSVLEADHDAAAFAPAYGAILLEGAAPGTGKVRRIVLRKTLPVDNVESAYKKDGLFLIPVTWRTHYVSASIKAWKMEDQP